MLDAGNGLAVVRCAARGDQDILRAHPPAAVEHQRMRVLEHGARLDHLHARFLHVGGVGRFQPGDLLVFVGDQGGPVERRRRNGPAEARGIRDVVAEMRGVGE